MALLSRVKIWISGEILTASDLNGEFNNIINNGLDNTKIVGSSANVTAMQVTIDPGEVGTESLASSNDGEIKRLRNIVKEITGATQWYETPSRDLSAGNLAVLRADLPSVGQQISSNASSSTVSTTFVDLTNLTVTITTTGRPVLVFAQASGSGDSFFDISNGGASNAVAELRMLRDAVDVGTSRLQTNPGGATSAKLSIPPSSIFILDPTNSGTFTYKMQGKVNSASTTLSFTNIELVAFEL